MSSLAGPWAQQGCPHCTCAHSKRPREPQCRTGFLLVRVSSPALQPRLHAPRRVWCSLLTPTLTPGERGPRVCLCVRPTSRFSFSLQRVAKFAFKGPWAAPRAGPSDSPPPPAGLSWPTPLRCLACEPGRVPVCPLQRRPLPRLLQPHLVFTFSLLEGLPSTHTPPPGASPQAPELSPFWSLHR